MEKISEWGYGSEFSHMLFLQSRGKIETILQRNQI